MLDFTLSGLADLSIEMPTHLRLVQKVSAASGWHCLSGSGLNVCFDQHTGFFIHHFIHLPSEIAQHAATRCNGLQG